MAFRTADRARRLARLARGAALLFLPLAALACNSGEVTNPANTVWIALTDGLTHSCGLSVDGHALCWGGDQYGQVGAGRAGDITCAASGISVPCRITPTRIASSLPFALAHATANRTCATALDATGTYCWGAGWGGLLNSTTQDTSSVPVRVTSSSFLALAGTLTAECGLDNVGLAYCWGIDHYGELGQESAGVTAKEPLDVLSPTRFAGIAGGDYHVCALTADGSPVCWGRNDDGQLGLGTRDADPHPTPTAVTTALRFRSIAAGGNGTCAVAMGGDVYCWGNVRLRAPTSGSDYVGATTPTKIVLPEAMVAVAVGSQFACAIGVEGAPYCWGDNHLFQTGNGGSTPSTYAAPALVAGGHAFARISAGTNHVCALTTTSDMFCWGAGQAGQLATQTLPATCPASDEFIPCTSTPLAIPDPR